MEAVSEGPNLDASGVPLSDVCRCCLDQSENMFNLTEKSKQILDLIAMLTSVGNIEIEINDMLPAYLCNACESKLRLSHDFQMLVRRSNDFIKECVTYAMESVEDENGDVKINKSNEDEINVQKRDENEVKVRKKIRNRIELFPDYEVNAAIEEYKNTFLREVKCIKCELVTSTLRSMSIHISVAHNEIKGRWCSLCNAEFEDLTKHSETHLDKWKCKFCGKKCPTSGTFHEHLKAHSILKYVSCTICDKKFPRQWLLDQHIKKHKESSENEVSAKKNKIKSEGVLCPQCGKTFRINYYRRHMRIHSGEFPYNCRFCDKRMRNRYSVVLHERTHTGEKPYVCTVCGREFSQLSCLNTHSKLHTGRPVKCDLCPKRFCRRAQLRMHMRSHTGEKPYKCNQCEQAFKQKSHLSEHLKRHSSVRPYQCQYCDKSFKQISTFKTHVTIHTGEKPFKCQHCSYACRQKHALTQHSKQHR